MNRRNRVCTGGFVLLLMLLASGWSAAQSVFPLYEKGEKETEPALVGTWNAWGLRFQFEPVEDGGYTLTIADYDEKLPLRCTYRVHLVRLRRELYLDAEFEKTTIAGKNASELALAIPIHLLLKVTIDNDQLTMILPSDEWFLREAKSGNVRLRYETFGDVTLLLAPTDELRDFVSVYSDDLFGSSGDKLTLTRVPEET